MKIKSAYENALNQDDLDVLMPYLSESFTGSFVTGDEISDRRALQAYWDKVKRIIGQGRPGAGYRVKLNPEDVRIDGGSAYARGSTDEEVVTGSGQRLRYRSLWQVRLNKDGGRWTVSSLESKADPLDKLTLAVQLIATRMWFPAHYLKAPTDRDPDFDGDRGRNVKDALPAAGKL